MQLNSIFRKWAAAFIAIAFSVILVLTLSMSWLVQRDFYRQGLHQLNQRAKTIEETFEAYQQGVITLPEFRKALKRMEQEHDVQISVIGKKVKYLQKELLEVGERPDVRKWVTSVSEGNRIETNAKFRKQDNDKMLIVGFPLMQKKDVVASAFIYVPVTNVKELAEPIRRSIWLVALACTGPLILLLWFAIRRFVRPIKEMSVAAARVAEGDFTHRVQVRGKDEVARLGISFNRMAERIERIEDRRRQLIMEIAHELRTPLTTIRATLQAISDGILTGQEQKEFVPLSIKEAERLGQLIDHLHELSAFEEHQVQFEFRTINVTQLVEQTAAQFLSKAEEDGMRLYVDADRDKPIYMDAETARLRQVLVNLIGNALHHNRGDIIVHVRLFMEHDKVKIIVQDNGQGIAPEHVPHLFERLYKAESSRSSRGSGLGLTISRYIVDAHGGTITAASKLGEGTTIEIELPCTLGMTNF